ncbi:B3 domain-containing protein Os07g0563300-like isoform X1 [Rosa rugosa]|uniref:B3 domain-containing protein Os07g0563300-like isoform X1 n=1 Tax=Rosa rugosa TaxID=74645 RepID=UPI002B40147F|nr:B3 domain-containing protein Os07g0563300-like isoform X1 [Rosa rugosa]
MSPSSSSSSSKCCYNSECGELKPEHPRKAWRLRTGDFAELCDRCALIYEEGRFCETFHVKASGWRCCESCGKRVHCGCIVSAQAFTLLDPGGIECVTCARKHIVLTSNPAWAPTLFFHSPLSDRLKDMSGKNWTQLAGSGPVPWRQAPSLFNSSISSSELHGRLPYDVDGSMGINKLNAGERVSVHPLEKKKAEDFSERLMKVNLAIGTPVSFENGNSGNKCMEQSSSCLNISQQPASLKEEPSTPQFVLSVPYVSASETNGQVVVTGTNLRPALPMVKQFNGTLHNGVELSGDTQIRNARPRADARGRSPLLPRYWPRFTDQELQQMSGDSNSVITPLFEKMLSASDAGRIGRLVLPKKCAEAYFPPISQPEGLPLKVQDSKGKEWVFQFRFWPNNNSRMYVLEGVTPCIQSMQLQAGDIVTFSRLEPGGKLVMGCRRASTAPSDQENDTNKMGNGVSAHVDVSITDTKSGEVFSNAELADPSTFPKGDKSSYISKEVEGAKSLISRKRKNSNLGSKSKRLRIEKEDLIELKITWEEAQGLLRPPPNHVPTVVVIEGFEFEEYEDGPILGKPTLYATGSKGEKIQWAQCEACCKWRKLPVNALLPSKWTCSDNSWDPDRSLCSAAQELTTEQLEDLLPRCNSVAPKKIRAAKQDPDNIEALEGLDTLANLAILGEGESLPASAQATTKHPRHRPGCSCIVCIQPPSGKGPKHKQTCICNVCSTVKRRFRTLMMRREKNKSEKEAETTRKKQQQQQLLDDETLLCGNAGSSSPNNKVEVLELSDDDFNRTKSPTPPYKGQIDLNIQPEREEDLSPGSDSGGVIKLLQDATERYLRQQRQSLSTSGGGERSMGNKSQRAGGEAGGEPLGNIAILGNSNHDSGNDHPATLSVKASASMTAT